MKKLLLATTAALMLGITAASAYELQCGPPRMLYGADEGDTNPVMQTAVKYEWDSHSWQVFHQLRNGQIVARGNQYGMTDASNERRTQWQGRLLRQPWLFMVGEVKMNDKNEYGYYEWMYDSKRGNALVMQSVTLCSKRQQLPVPTTQAPTQQQPPPQATVRSRDSVPIIISANGSAIHVDVLVGGMPLRMLVDTGAQGSQVPPTFASMLLRNGGATEAAPVIVTYANGSKGTEPSIMIREIRIGGHTVRNVRATVTDGTPLIGFPIINGIAPFTIDTRVGELIWHTQG